MNFTDILDSIPVIKEADVTDRKVTLEDVIKLHPTLDYEDPLTYAIFLDRRPDLSEEDKNCIIQIMRRLSENRQTLYNAVKKDMVPVSVVKNNS